MFKYAPQLSLTKDVASTWVIVRRGLGLSEGVPKNYRAFLQAAQKSPQRKVGIEGRWVYGRNFSSGENLKRSPYNPWRVLRVAVLTALSPERLPRCLSPLKPILVSGDVGRTLKGREFPLPGAGTMGAQMPPAGFLTL